MSYMSCQPVPRFLSGLGTRPVIRESFNILHSSFKAIKRHYARRPIINLRTTVWYCVGSLLRPPRQQSNDRYLFISHDRRLLYITWRKTEDKKQMSGFLFLSLPRYDCWCHHTFSPSLAPPPSLLQLLQALHSAPPPAAAIITGSILICCVRWEVFITPRTDTGRQVSPPSLPTLTPPFVLRRCGGVEVIVVVIVRGGQGRGGRWRERRERERGWGWRGKGGP